MKKDYDFDNMSKEEIRAILDGDDDHAKDMFAKAFTEREDAINEIRIAEGKEPISFMSDLLKGATDEASD